MLIYTNRIESLLVSRSQTHIVCFAGQKKDGCMTFLRRSQDGFILSVFGPLAELSKRCDRMIHKGRTVPYNPQLIAQASLGHEDAYAVVYCTYDFNRFSMETLEVNFDDLPQSNLIMAGFFVVEAQTNNTNFEALKALSKDYQVKLAVHSDLPADKTLKILKKVRLAIGTSSSDLDMPMEEALNLSSTALIDGAWLHSAFESGSVGKVKRILAKPLFAVCNVVAGDHASVLGMLQDLGYSVVALCTREEDNEDLRRADFSVSFASASHDSCKYATDLVLLDEDLSQLIQVKAMAETQEGSYEKIQVSICAFYLPVTVSILLATAFDYRLSTMMLFCVEMGSVMIPVFSLGFSQSSRFYTFSPLQNWLIITGGALYTFAIVLADYGYFGGECIYQDACLKAEAFDYAQSAFFIAVLMGQWASSALINIDQSLNGFTHLHWGSVHLSSIIKLVMAYLLCYIPQLNSPLHTRQIRWQHFGFPAVLLLVVLFLLELVRSKVFR